MGLRFRRYYGIPVLLALLAAVLVMGLGNQAIVAYSLPGNTQAVVQVTRTSSDLTRVIEPIVHSLGAVRQALGL